MFTLQTTRGRFPGKVECLFRICCAYVPQGALRDDFA